MSATTTPQKQSLFPMTTDSRRGNSGGRRRQKQGGLTPVRCLVYTVSLVCSTVALTSVWKLHTLLDGDTDSSGHGSPIGSMLSNFLRGDETITMIEPAIPAASASAMMSTKKLNIIEPRKSDTNHADKKDAENDDEAPHYHTLQCDTHGGPSNEAAQEMVYWQDIQSDSHYVSPFHQSDKTQYMTFEPDGGGWNNIRMAMETVVGLAIATGRTLVLPAEQRMYLLAKSRGKGHKSDFGFMDFFPMRELANDNDGLNMITMEEFLQREAMTGHLFDKNSGEVSFPPNNETDWNGKDVKVLKEWLRNVTDTPRWSPSNCLAVFPATGDHKDNAKLEELHSKLMKTGKPMPQYMDEPVAIDAPLEQRLQEALSGRKRLCLYDEGMQEAPVLHFMCSHKDKVRMLVHFYAFLFLEDWRADLWMKRFMRDHMRYVDSLQCAAARIVDAVRTRARAHNATNVNGDFDTFHIRRGDFQYKATRIDADKIYDSVKNILTDGATVYIATDERDKKFFDDLKKHYNVLFMDDFTAEMEGVNPNQFGMIDQIVASRGRIFFGCWHSTFTGFINRMRGYHSVRENLPGHEDGRLVNTYYYVGEENKMAMQKYAPLKGAFFNREFPTSWRQLDYGIGNLPVSSH